jgi:hypothetical protein
VGPPDEIGAMSQSCDVLCDDLGVLCGLGGETAMESASICVICGGHDLAIRLRLQLCRDKWNLNLSV